MLRTGLEFSSIIYRVFNEGIAMNIKSMAGIEVQNNSISWASKKNLLNFFDLMDEINKYIVINVIVVKIIIEWSWKKIKCSIKGEFLFWKDNEDHVGIFRSN